MHATERDVVATQRQNRLFKSVKGSFGETINVQHDTSCNPSARHGDLKM